MWASVPSSPRILLAAIMWIALLARPFPPRSSPCPSVFPLGAGMGDAPRIEASFASFGMRSGLSPAAIASPAASTVPLQHLHLQGGWRIGLDEPMHGALRPARCLIEPQPGPGKRSQGGEKRPGDAIFGTRAAGSQFPVQARSLERPVPVPGLLRRRYREGACGVGRAAHGADVHGPRHRKGARALDPPVAGLRDRAFSGRRRAVGAPGVDAIGPALSDQPLSPFGAKGLEDGAAALHQVGAEAGAIRRRPLHAYRRAARWAADFSRKPPAAFLAGGKRPGRDEPAEAVEDDWDVEVLVGAHPCVDRCALLHVSTFPIGSRPLRDRMPDATLTGVP